MSRVNWKAYYPYGNNLSNQFSGHTQLTSSSPENESGNTKPRTGTWWDTELKWWSNMDQVSNVRSNAHQVHSLRIFFGRHSYLPKWVKSALEPKNTDNASYFYVVCNWSSTYPRRISMKGKTVEKYTTRILSMSQTPKWQHFRYQQCAQLTKIYTTLRKDFISTKILQTCTSWR